MKIIKAPNEIVFDCECGCKFSATENECSITVRQPNAVEMLLAGKNNFTIREITVTCPYCCKDMTEVKI